MRRLHGGYYVELGKTREIFESDDLGVLDAIAAIAGAVGFGDGFEDIEGDAIGAVADGVEGELEASFVALDGHLAKFIGIHDEDARSGGVVGVRREHSCGTRAESTVGDHFQGARFKPRIGDAALTAQILQIAQRRGEAEPFGDADGELAFFLDVAIDEEIVPIGIVLDGGDAIFGKVNENQVDAFAALRGRRIGHVLSYEAHCRTFFQNAREFAVLGAFEFSSFGIGGVVQDASKFEGEGVSDRDVT